MSFLVNFAKFLRTLFLKSSSGFCLWKSCHHYWPDHFEDCSKVLLKVLLSLFWKLNLMSNIHELKSQLYEWNLQSNMMYFCFSFTLTIRNGFDINCIRLWTFFCKFYMLSIKFNYAAPFSLLKLLQIWFHLSASLFDPFVSFLCLRLFNISYTCPRHAFDPVKCKARFLFCDVFHCCLC